MKISIKGITLVEIMAVILIISTLGIIATPSLKKQISYYDLELNASNLIFSLQKAKTNAAMYKKTITIDLTSYKKESFDYIYWKSINNVKLKPEYSKLFFHPNGFLQFSNNDDSMIDPINLTLCNSSHSVIIHINNSAPILVTRSSAIC